MDKNLWGVVVGKAVNHIGTRLSSLNEEIKHFFPCSPKKKNQNNV